MQQLANELAALRDELEALVRDQVSLAAASSRDKIGDATKVVGEAVEDLERFFTAEEENLERAIAGHPLASVAAAFVAGLAVGLIAGRR